MKTVLIDGVGVSFTSQQKVIEVFLPQVKRKLLTFIVKKMYRYLKNLEKYSSQTKMFWTEVIDLIKIHIFYGYTFSLKWIVFEKKYFFDFFKINIKTLFLRLEPRWHGIFKWHFRKPRGMSRFRPTLTHNSPLFKVHPFC